MSEYPFHSVFLDTNIVHYIGTFPNLFFEGGPDDEEEARLARLKPRHRQDILSLTALTAMLERATSHDVVITSSVVNEMPRAKSRQVV